MCEDVSLSDMPPCMAYSEVAVGTRAISTVRDAVMMQDKFFNPSDVTINGLRPGALPWAAPSRATSASPSISGLPVLLGRMRCLLNCILAWVARVIRHLPRILSVSSHTRS